MKREIPHRNKEKERKQSCQTERKQGHGEAGCILSTGACSFLLGNTCEYQWTQTSCAVFWISSISSSAFLRITFHCCKFVLFLRSDRGKRLQTDDGSKGSLQFWDKTIVQNPLSWLRKHNRGTEVDKDAQNASQLLLLFALNESTEMKMSSVCVCVRMCVREILLPEHLHFCKPQRFFCISITLQCASQISFVGTQQSEVAVCFVCEESPDDPPISQCKFTQTPRLFA